MSAQRTKLSISLCMFVCVCVLVDGGKRRCFRRKYSSPFLFSLCIQDNDFSNYFNFCPVVLHYLVLISLFFYDANLYK